MADIYPTERLFLITMNMPARSGNQTHMVFAKVDGVETIEELNDLLVGEDFLVVDEYYKKSDSEGYYSVGQTILNTVYIGKVKLTS